MLWKNPFAAADAKVSNNQPPPQQNQSIPGAKPDAKLPESGITPDQGDTTDTNKNSTEGDDPLKQFGNLWEPNKDKDGNPVQTSQDDDSFLPKVDPAKFGQVLEKMDFTKNISQDEWAAIQAGGEGSVKALQGILNKANRHGFATMFNAMSKMVENGFKNAHNKFTSGVPEIVRDFMTEDGLTVGDGTNAIMKNPAFSPLVKQVKNQYLTKFPKATPSEVNAGVKQYFDYLAGELNKKQTTTSGKKDNNSKLRTGEDDADFLQWIEKEVGSTQTADSDQT